jgi:hypothetical protein
MIKCNGSYKNMHHVVATKELEIACKVDNWLSWPSAQSVSAGVSTLLVEKQIRWAVETKTDVTLDSEV